MSLTGTLPDGTRWEVHHGCGCFTGYHRPGACPGGIHHNGGTDPWVLLTRDRLTGAAETIALVARRGAVHRIAETIRRECQLWTDVPMAVEARDFTVVAAAAEQTGDQ